MAKNRRTNKQPAGGRKKTLPAAANRRAAPRTRRLKAATRAANYSPPAEREPMRIPLTWLKLVAGVLMLPLCLVTALAFFDTFMVAAVDRGFWRAQEFWFFGLGVLVWGIAFWGLPRPVSAYVFGHELTHAFFILLCGGRIEKFKTGPGGGYVVTDKNNVAISLSPYFVPIYTVVVILGFAVLALFVDVTRVYPDVLYGVADFKPAWVLFALIGVTWGFHLTFTVWMIAKDQPDLRENGVFFSLVLIFLINLLVISAGLVFASPETTFREFGENWVSSMRGLGGWLGKASESVL